MSTEQNQDGVVDENNEGEGTEGGVVTLKKEEYAKLNETIGSLKRDLKDLKNKAEETPEIKKETKSDEKLLESYNRVSMKLAGLVEADEVEFFEKWRVDNGYENADIDTVLDKKGFKTELADFRTAKANAAATANIKGEGGKGGERDDPAYWLAKATKDSEGNPIFPDDLPNDYKLRAAIVEKMIASTKNKKEFYNSP